jgi:DNA-binding CsgD family transcriptional regulator
MPKPFQLPTEIAGVDSKPIGTRDMNVDGYTSLALSGNPPKEPVSSSEPQPLIEAAEAPRPSGHPGSNIFPESSWGEIARNLRLTHRETQIVRGVFDDRTELAIAADLGISPHTVHTHIERVRNKLAVADRASLILRVVQEFLRLTVVPGGVLPPICSRHAAGLCQH